VSAHPYGDLRRARAFRAGQDFSAAIESASRAVERTPGFSEGHYELGRALWASGEAAAACSAFNSALVFPERRTYPAETTLEQPLLLLQDYFGRDVYFGPKGYHATPRIARNFRLMVKSLMGARLFERLRTMRNAYLLFVTSRRRLTTRRDAFGESLFRLLRSLHPR
jgi:hypothetical protein